MFAAPKSDKFRIGICGFGRFAKRRLMPAMTTHDEIELVSVVQRKQTGEWSYPGIRPFNSLEELIEFGGLNLIHVCTPNWCHFNDTMKCIEHKMDVICEKPLSINSRLAFSLIEHASSNNCNLFVGHMLRCSPAIKKVKSIINSGVLGQISTVSISLQYFVDSSTRTWVFDPEVSGGGCLIDAGVHCIDVIQFLFLGELCLSGSSILERSNGVETSVFFQVGVGDIMCDVSLNCQSKYNSELKIVGNKCTLLVSNFSACWGHANILVLDTNGGEILTCHEVDVSDTYRKQYEHVMVSCVRKRSDFSDVIDAAKSLKMIEEIYHCS